MNTKSAIQYDVSNNLTTGELVVKLNDNIKSLLEIGNLKIYNTKSFNWFNRFMFKLVFGISIKDIKEDK